MGKWPNGPSFRRLPLPRVPDMKIRLCDRNKGKGKIYRKLREKYPDLDIKIRGCIKECRTCGEKPVAVVSKVRVSARTSDNLYRKIVEAIKKEG